MKQILNASKAGIQILTVNFHMIWNQIFPLIGNHTEFTLQRVPLNHSCCIKHIRDLFFYTGKGFHQTLHAQLRR